MAFPSLVGVNLPTIGKSAGNVTIKVSNTHTGEIRRVSLPEWPSGLVGLDQLLRTIFGHTLPNPYYVQYTDVDGDTVSITSGIELEEAVSQANTKAAATGRPLLLLKVGSLRADMRNSLISSAIATEQMLTPSRADHDKKGEVKVPEHFEAKVRQLLAKGYTNVDQNIAMLIKHGCDVEMVVLEYTQNRVSTVSDPQAASRPIKFPAKFIEYVYELQTMGFTDLALNVEALLANGAILTEAALALVNFAPEEASNAASSSTQPSSIPTTTTPTTTPTPSSSNDNKNNAGAEFTLPDSIRGAVLSLEAMGFGDRMHVIETLIKFGGNEQQAALQLTHEEHERKILKDAEDKKAAEEAARKKAEEEERLRKEQETLNSISLPEKFQKNILELHRMGFSDVNLNTSLLIKNAGDLDATITDLLNNLKI